MADTTTFSADCAVLTAYPHRLTGSAGFTAAATHVEQRLAEIGVDAVIRQQFLTARAEVKRCELTLDGGVAPLALHPMRPNGLMHPVTPLDGLTGRIVHAGMGAASDFSSTDVLGAIVVLDYNAGDGWARAFRFGARAVVFVGNGPGVAWRTRHVEGSINLPRFYYPGPASDLPEGRLATIHSDIVWVPAVGENVVGFIRGTDATFEQEKEEAVIFSAPLDSYGDVTTLAPGARQAANAAALLDLAGRFTARRSRRHVVVAFLGGELNGQMGSSAFYRALETEERHRKAWYESRTNSVASEKAFLEGLRGAMERGEDLEGDSVDGRQVLERLRLKAAGYAVRVADALVLAQDEARTLEKSGRADEATALRAQARDKWLPQKGAWNEVRRALGRGGCDALQGLAREQLEQVRDGVRDDIEGRLSELVFEAKALEQDGVLRALLRDKAVVLHISMLLGDGSPRWATVVGAGSGLHSRNDDAGVYGKVQNAFLEAWRELGGSNGLPRFVSASVDQSLAQSRPLWDAFWFVHSGDVAGLFGIYNMALATCQDRLLREGTPGDTLAALDTGVMYGQLDEMAALMRTALDGRGLSLRRAIVPDREYALPYFDNGYVQGPMVLGALSGTSLADTPVPGAVVLFSLNRTAALAHYSIKSAGFENSQVQITGRNGSYSLGPCLSEGVWGGVYGGVAAVFDERGGILSFSDRKSYADIKNRLAIYPCRAGALPLPPQAEPYIRRNNFWEADTGIKGLSSLANAALDDTKSYVETVDGFVNWFVSTKEKGIKLFGLANMVVLNNGPETLVTNVPAGAPDGVGIALETPPGEMRPAMRSASDLWRLNDSRIRLLDDKKVMDRPLADLHGHAGELLTRAGAAAPLSAEALATSAYWMSQRVYREVRAKLDDLVFAVLILLGLCVPFAFAAERVIIGAVTVYRQILGYAGFFVATFIALYLTHPAFAIANTPIIIFLGFIIVVMSAMVIFIILQKFEVELKALQGMTATVHTADVSRVSTFMAAMSMGISTMRRRPMRTALTAVTVILLTFTILCFASFSTQLGLVRMFAEPAPSYTGVWVHRVNWMPLTQDMLDVMHGRWGPAGSGQAAVFPRYWACRWSSADIGAIVTRDDGTRPVFVAGLAAFEPAEFEYRADLRALLETNLEGRIQFGEALTRSLGVREGDYVRYRGIRLQVARPFDAALLSAAKDMDGIGVLPVDFAMANFGKETEEDMNNDLTLARQSWSSIPADAVCVVSASTARLLRLETQGVMMYTRNHEDATEVCEELARMVAFPVVATRENGVYLHVLGTVLSASGVADLFFPILLGGLVIFGTMLGSVSDRQREIYTFSALGLAPRHVATLFFAEAAIYSLLGGMGGYMLAQAVVRGLTFLSQWGWVRVPDMNMSSTNTIATILIVMATVLASAIYPAVKASRSANPGLMRAWRPPRPEGNVLEMVFPFTVSEYDITGVVSFLKEHFGNYSDTGLGIFMARNVRLERDAGRGLSIGAELALAPFDLGVSQTLVLRSTPSEIPGIDEVHIRCERRSGQPKDWERLNKTFLDDLRRQFLIWRSLPHETMESYRQRTLVELGGGGVGVQAAGTPGGVTRSG